jgi:hypothetical protein
MSYSRENAEDPHAAVRYGRFTLVAPSEAALIVRFDGTITLCLPGADDPALTARMLTLALVAPRLTESAWVESFVADAVAQMMAADIAAQDERKPDEPGAL